MNFKPVLDHLIATPLLTSFFIVDFGILTFYNPPPFFSLIMLGALVAMSMYFGQKLGLYSLNKPS